MPALKKFHREPLRELVVQLQEWNEREGYTYPAMPMEGSCPNFFTINGKAYPSTDGDPRGGGLSQEPDRRFQAVGFRR